MQVTAKIRRILAAEHISDAELAHMVKHAAITSHEGFNRRFHHWLFRVRQGGMVIDDMRHTAMLEIGTGDASVFEEHDVCKGDGCRECGWSGEIIRRVSDTVADSLTT